jgi:hypothetical protein
MNPDGSGLTRLSNNTASDEVPTWSPDGTKIVFDSNRSGNFEVWVMNADGTNPVKLTNNAAFDGHPSWARGAAAAMLATGGPKLTHWLLDSSERHSAVLQAPAYTSHTFVRTPPRAARNIPAGPDSHRMDLRYAA